MYYYLFFTHKTNEKFVFKVVLEYRDDLQTFQTSRNWIKYKYINE